MKTIILFLTLGSCAPAWAGEYSMVGINTATRERVLAQMTSNSTTGQLSGTVHDQYFALAASGAWTGKGRATVRGGGNTYLLEVTR